MNQYKWCAFKTPNGRWYATRSIWNKETKTTKTTTMHKFIMNPATGFEVDHKDGNGLNNQKSNLRNCKHYQNTRNQLKAKNKSSKYKGVCFASDRQKWRAAICVDGKKIPLGTFENEKDAADAYDKAAIKYFGEFAKTNTELLEGYVANI